MIEDSSSDDNLLHQLKNANIGNYSEDLQDTCRVLDNCMNINVSTLISKMNQDYNLNFYFYNIDGNKSNFDTLAGEPHRFSDKFSFIGHVQTWLVVLLHCQNGRFSHFYNNSINNYSMVLKLSDMIIIVITNSLRSSAMNNIVKWPSYIEKCNIWLHFSMAQPIIKF